MVEEDGKILSFEYLLTLDYGANQYVILGPMAPYDDSEDDLTGDEVVILKVEQDENGDDVYISIEDEKELDEVFDAFSEIIAQDENEDS